MRTCSKCGGVFPATREFFYAQKDGFKSACKPCENEVQQKYRQKPEVIARRREIAWRYQGIRFSFDEYESKYEDLDGRCQVCRDRRLILDVDHDPRTGGVRGLLCNSCNQAIGSLDNAWVLLSAVKYLWVFRLRRLAARLLALPEKLLNWNPNA